MRNNQNDKIILCGNGTRIHDLLYRRGEWIVTEKGIHRVYLPSENAVYEEMYFIPSNTLWEKRTERGGAVFDWFPHLAETSHIRSHRDIKDFFDCYRFALEHFSSMRPAGNYSGILERSTMIMQDILFAA